MVTLLSRSNSSAGPATGTALDPSSQDHTEPVHSNASNSMVVAEGARSDAAASKATTIRQIPFNESFRIWPTILARCLPKDMVNFSLASGFCHAIYRQTLYTLFRPQTDMPRAVITKEIVDFLASDAFKGAVADNAVFLPQDPIACKCFEALFAKDTRLDKTYQGDLLKIGKLLLDGKLYSQRKLESLIDAGICTLSNTDFVQNSIAPADQTLSMLLNEKQWDFIIHKIPAILATRQKREYEELLLKLLGEDKGIETFRLLMKLGVNKNTLLLTAVKEKCPSSIIELLLNNGANPNITDEDGNNLLQIAFSKRYPRFVMQLLLQKGADPNVLDKEGKTLLQCLVAMSRVEIAEDWKGRSSFITNAWEISALEAEIAAEEFRLSLMKCLLKDGEHKADPNIQSEEGADTALLIALKKSLPFHVIKCLLKYNANLNITDKDGNTPLQIAFSSQYPLAVIQLLRQKGANPHVPNKEGKTLLQRLIAMSSAQIDKSWKESGSFIAEADEIGLSPAEAFRFMLMQCLLDVGENKAPPNMRSKDLNNALQIAFQERRSVPVMLFLMEHKASPMNIKDAKGETIWHILLEGLQSPINPDLFNKFKQHFESVHFNPLRSKADRTILQTAKRKKHNSIVSFLQAKMQNTLAREVETKYHHRFAWLGRLFNRFQIWWFGL